jgi:hypothetical protein
MPRKRPQVLGVDLNRSESSRPPCSMSHKKGGAHFDHTRKKDEQAYCAFDAAIESGLWFGASPAGQPGQKHGKNPVYLELLSIGQNLTNSSDIRRFMDGASNVLDRCR